MRVEWEVRLGFKDVLIKPKRSTLKSRRDVSLVRDLVFKNSRKVWSGVPIIASNMDTIGTFDVARVMSSMQLMTTIHKHYKLEEWSHFCASLNTQQFEYIAVSTGILDADLEQLNTILTQNPQLQFICVDVANGYTQFFVDRVRILRERYPNHTLIAGNVVTPEMAEELILSGADIVKVGIGPGSVCTTRVKTGVGFPQLSAIMECADAAHGLKGHVISDGGCACPGDIAKGFAAGADFVMLGGMLAGHNEGGGTRRETEDGRSVIEFYGMSSKTAMDKHSGGVAEYRASEGKTVSIDYRGPLENTIKDILGGVRSTCTYVGAEKLKELSKRTTFIRVLEQENRVYS